MKKNVIKELQRISQSIPKELLDKLMVKRLKSPTVVEVVKKALADDTVSKEKKEQLQHLVDSGYLNQEETVTDPEIEKQIDAYMDKEIERAIKLGRIPDPKKDKDLKDFRKKIKKLQKNAKEKNQL